MKEIELITKARQGDKDAFCKLYSLYKNRLYRYAFYKLGNADDAQDAVSDCIVSAFEQIGNLRRPQAFPSWIFSILHSSCAKYIKSQIRQRESISTDDESSCVNLFVVEENDTTDLQKALALLKEQERDIVLLSVVAGFNSKEIAKVTGLTSGGVRSKLSRSLSKMREYLE